MFVLVVLSLATLGCTNVFSTESPPLSQRCLKAHNEYRTRHGAPQLLWSGELADEAQNWANHLASIDQMERDPDTKDGENIFYMYGGDPAEACDRAVENWYSEVKGYDFKDPRDKLNTDHFSQVVWKNTKELGVGAAQSKSGNFFLVARYSPRGNTDGAFTDNVNDVFLDVNPSKSQTTSTKPKETADLNVTTTTSKVSTPTVAITTTTDPSVSMATTNSSFSIPEGIFENGINSQTEPTEDVNNMDHGNHGNTSEIGNHDNDTYSSKAKDAAMLMKPPQLGKDFKVELRFTGLEYKDKMAYPSSKEFEDVKLMVTTRILQIYEEDDDFQEVQLLELRNGSVIASLGFIFAKSGPGHMDKLTSAVAEGKLGDLEMSRDYVLAAVLPDGYLKLSLPHQPSTYGQCPQPCSDPTHCFNAGCHVACCSFQATPSPSHLAPVHPSYHHPSQSVCPGNCVSSCYPQCSTECCLNKSPTSVSQAEVSQPPEVHQPETYSPEVHQQEVHSPEVHSPEIHSPEIHSPEVHNMSPGYSCPATCPFSCYPQCTPGCCQIPSPVCSSKCSNVCSVVCPQECCARKSAIHKSVARHYGNPVAPNALPPTYRGSKLAYMYREKPGAPKKPVYGRVSKTTTKFVAKRPEAEYLNKITSFRNPSFRLVDALNRFSYKNKGVSLGNPVARYGTSYRRPMKTTEQPRKIPYTGIPSRHIDPKLRNYGPSKPTLGMHVIHDLKSQGAPVDIKFAYRYGNRLLVPIDMPNMDIKELQGKKFISVPAFKRSVNSRKNQQLKTLYTV